MPCGPQNVCFISHSLITPKHFGTAVSYRVYMFPSWQHIYDPNTWFVKLFPELECSCTKCVLWLFTSQPNTDEFLSSSAKTQKQLILFMFSLALWKWGFGLQYCKIWASFHWHSPPQNSHPFHFPRPDGPTKNWFHSPQPSTPKTIYVPPSRFLMSSRMWCACLIQQG